MSPRKGISIAITVALLVSKQCGAQAVGAAFSISAGEFLKLPDDARVAYVAGVIDGITFTSYSHNLPDHDRYIRCVRTLTVGALNKGQWIGFVCDHHSQRAPASAVSQMIGAWCTERGLR